MQLRLRTTESQSSQRRAIHLLPILEKEPHIAPN